MTTEYPSSALTPARRPLSLFVRLLLWFGGIFVGLALLFLMLVGIENWRGHSAWAKAKRDLAAQGEKLALADFVPPPVPDEQNFAATPLFASLHYRQGDGGAPIAWPEDYGNAQKEIKKPRRNGRGADPTPTFTDLAAWQRAFRITRNGDAGQPLPITAPPNATAEVRAALEVLEGLKVYDPMLTELRQASQRPQARFPVEYDNSNPMLILLPHLAGLKGVCLVLQLRASAELAAGQAQAGFEDALLLLRLADSPKDEPTLISQLVRNACFQIAVVPIREGLARQAWTEAQLKQLQARLQQFDFVATAQRAMRAERAFGLGQMDVLLRGQPTTQLGDEGLDGWDKPMETYRRLVPTGWLRFEQANLARTMQSMLLPDAEIEQRRIDPRKVQRAQAAFEKSLQPPWKSVPQHRVFCHLLIPALGRSYSKFAYAQTVADQAMLACALERYRLAKGQFPAALDALVPACLEKIPPDVITGEPMHYRRTPDGQFLLWSVGWNEEDEDGTPGDSASDDKRGDWVWQYPSK